MKTLEITNLPDDLYQHIELLARERGQSLGDLAAEFVARAIAADEAAEAQSMAEIRADREALAKRGVYVNEQILREAKNWGRE